MRDLAAQVTSSLLCFPRVTVDALGEDEITLDSVLHGKFTVGKSVCMHGGDLSLSDHPGEDRSTAHPQIRPTASAPSVTKNNRILKS